MEIRLVFIVLVVVTGCAAEPRDSEDGKTPSETFLHGTAKAAEGIAASRLTLVLACELNFLNRDPSVEVVAQYIEDYLRTKSTDRAEPTREFEYVWTVPLSAQTRAHEQASHVGKLMRALIDKAGLADLEFVVSARDLVITENSNITALERWPNGITPPWLLR